MRDYKYRFHKLTQSSLPNIYIISTLSFTLTELNFNGDTNTGFSVKSLNNSLGQFRFLFLPEEFKFFEIQMKNHSLQETRVLIYILFFL